MQVTRIECTVGFTINTGDFQNIKAAVSMTAELDRNEDPDAAYAQLRGKVLANCVAMGADAHPDRVRALLSGQAALPAPTTLPGGTPGPAPAPEKVKGKPGPKPKTAAAPDPALNGSAPALLGETTLGGLDGEALLGSTEDDGEALLGGAPEPEVEVTLDLLRATLREVLHKKGKAAMVELLRKVGATDLGTIPPVQYKTLYAMAQKEAV